MSLLNMSRTLRVAKENDQFATSDVPVETVAPEAVDQVLADDVSGDVAAAAATADASIGEAAMLEETAYEADAQADAAETLTEAAEGPEGGVDEAGVKMAVAALERCRRHYNTGNGFKISRESLATKEGKRDVTMRLAREADNNSKTLWARVVEGAESLWKWIKEFVGGLFDKRKRLMSKAAALDTKVDGLKKDGAKAAPDAKITISGVAHSIGGSIEKDPAKLCAETASVVENMSFISTLANGSFGVDTKNAQVTDPKDEVIDMNPKKVGSMTLTMKFANFRADVTKETADAPAEVEVAPLDLDAIKGVTAAAKKAIASLQAAEKELKAAEKQVGGALGKLKALASGKETEVVNVNGADTKNVIKQDRGAILSRLRAVSTISSSISSVTLSAVDAALTTAAKSAAAYKTASK